MITFSIFNHTSSKAIDARKFLNDILYSANVSDRINLQNDTALNVRYTVAYHDGKLVGAARLCLNPAKEELLKSNILDNIKKYYPEYILYTAEEIYSQVCRNSGLAVLPEYRKGAFNLHIGNTLQQLRQNIACDNQRKFILMFSRKTAWNLAERNKFTALKEDTLITEGVKVPGKWYLKEAELYLITADQNLYE